MRIWYNSFEKFFGILMILNIYLAISLLDVNQEKW